MSFAVATAAIRARMAANWATTTIAWQNDPFDKPEPPAPWVYFEVLSGGAEIESLAATGAHLYTYDGIIRAHVFAPRWSGAALAEQYADSIGNIFRAATFSGVQCYAPSPGGAGPGDDDGVYWRVTVMIPFEYRVYL
jgi:hypothetical protein